jgi:hypothetical protein
MSQLPDYRQLKFSHVDVNLYNKTANTEDSDILAICSGIYLQNNTNSQICNLINFADISFIFTIGLMDLFVEN